MGRIEWSRVSVLGQSLTSLLVAGTFAWMLMVRRTNEWLDIEVLGEYFIAIFLNVLTVPVWLFTDFFDPALFEILEWNVLIVLWAFLSFNWMIIAAKMTSSKRAPIRDVPTDFRVQLGVLLSPAIVAVGGAWYLDTGLEAIGEFWLAIMLNVSLALSAILAQSYEFMTVLDWGDPMVIGIAVVGVLLPVIAAMLGLSWLAPEPSGDGYGQM